MDSPWQTAYNDLTLNEEQFTQAEAMFQRVCAADQPRSLAQLYPAAPWKKEASYRDQNPATCTDALRAPRLPSEMEEALNEGRYSDNPVPLNLPLTPGGGAGLYGVLLDHAVCESKERGGHARDPAVAV